MDLSYFNTVAIGALGFVLLAAFVIIPAARLIPKRMHAQWKADVEFEIKNRQNEIAVEYSYTPLQQALLILGAAGVGVFVLWKYGTEARGIAHAFYFLCLVLLVAINLKHELLPDSVVLTSLWAGLLLQASSGNASDSIYGAAAGYLAPYLLNLAFKVSMGGEVLGQGDMKALSMAGAWFGLSALPSLFVAYVGGLIAWGVGRKLAATRPRNILPSGPAHLFASLAVASGLSVF